MKVLERSVDGSQSRPVATASCSRAALGRAPTRRRAVPARQLNDLELWIQINIEVCAPVFKPVVE